MSSPIALHTGWFGKLPGAGDFAHRRLPTHLLQHWDGWLQHGMARLRERDAGWLQHYLSAPVWHGAIGPEVLDQQAWAVVMMPSVDAVGRYFPLSVLVPSAALSRTATTQWHARVTECLLQALDADDDAGRFDERLVAALSRAWADDEGSAPTPAPERSLWWADGAGQPNALWVDELPTPDRFAAFFLGASDVPAQV